MLSQSFKSVADLGEIFGSSFLLLIFTSFRSGIKVLRAGTEVKAASVPHASQRPRGGEKRVSLCRAYSAPAIRSKNLPENCMEESEGPVGGKVLEGPRIFFYALLHASRRALRGCASTLRSVAA